VKGAWAAIGIGVVVAHGVAFLAFADRARGQDLAVELGDTPLASQDLAIRGVPTIARAVVDDRDAHGTGLAHRRWSVTYQGGFSRGVGATQLVGPFQDPAKRACTGRVIVGQKLLDGGPHSVVATMAQMLEAELKGEEIFGAGQYEKLSGVTIAWAELAKHPDDAKMIGAAPHGYVRVTARIEFERVAIPLVLGLVPAIDARGQLSFSVATRAELDFDNRVLNWASDKVGADKLATKLAARQIDASLITTLAPPPPFDLPDGQRIEFTYCDEPPEIVDGAYAALPFAVTIGTVAGDRHVLPPRLGRGPHAIPSSDTVIALDLELDALNALLYELWRSGWLDRRLADVGLDRQFNTDPLVTEYLSIRISPVRLALPPVLTATPGGLQLAADGRVTIDASLEPGSSSNTVNRGASQTVGRVFGGLSFTFGAKSTEPTAVDLRALELSCEATPTLLVPCYADLVGALADRGNEFHGVLTTAFGKLLTDIFVAQRVGASGVPVDLVIHGVTPSVVLAAPNATLRLVLDAELTGAK
jgi:hypothetical protein